MLHKICIKHEFENKLKTDLKPKLSARIKLAFLLEHNERDFFVRIKSIEASQLFRRLFSPVNSSERVVSFARPYKLRLPGSFLELKDEIVSGGEQFDMQSLLSNRENAAQVIQALGEEKFKKYFLLNESGIDAGEIARQCAIKEQEVKDIIDLLNELASHAEFYSNSSISPEKSIVFNKIASIEKDGSGGFRIAYYMPHLAKGRYSIDYEKINEQKKLGLYSIEDLSEIDALIKQLEVINIRKTLIHRLIEQIIEFQKEYLTYAKASRLVPLNQKTVAKRLEVTPSIINRALYARSISVPSGKEVPLKEFFPSKKDVIKNIIRELLASGKMVLSDIELSGLLMDKFGYMVSRHLVQIYRKELGIAPAGRK